MDCQPPFAAIAPAIRGLLCCPPALRRPRSTARFARPLGPASNVLLEKRVGERLVDLPAEWRGRPGLAHNLGGDALGYLGKRPAVAHQRQDGVTLNIDEPRADDHPACVDVLAGLL